MVESLGFEAEFACLQSVLRRSCIAFRRSSRVKDCSPKISSQPAHEQDVILELQHTERFSVPSFRYLSATSDQNSFSSPSLPPHPSTTIKSSPAPTSPPQPNAPFPPTSSPHQQPTTSSAFPAGICMHRTSSKTIPCRGHSSLFHPTAPTSKKILFSKVAPTSVTAEKGQAFTMTVTDSRTGVAVRDASVDGVCTDASGQATLYLSDTGFFQFKAHQMGNVRSNVMNVTVTD